MLPTLQDHQIFLIDKDFSQEGGLKRGDVIVFSFDGKYFYVKRVIGLPGETVKMGGSKIQIKTAGGVYQTLVEPYLLGKNFDYGDDRYFIVPAGQEYFVLGDNRPHSEDSRFFVYPFIKLKDIYGRYIYP